MCCFMDAPLASRHSALCGGGWAQLQAWLPFLPLPWLVVTLAESLDSCVSPCPFVKRRIAPASKVTARTKQVNALCPAQWLLSHIDIGILPMTTCTATCSRVTGVPSWHRCSGQVDGHPLAGLHLGLQRRGWKQSWARMLCSHTSWVQIQLLPPPCCVT